MCSKGTLKQIARKEAGISRGKGDDRRYSTLVSVTPTSSSRRIPFYLPMDSRAEYLYYKGPIRIMLGPHRNMHPT